MTRKHVGAVWLCLLMALGTYPALVPVFRGHLLAYFTIDDLAFAGMLAVGPFVSIAASLATGLAVDRFRSPALLRLSLAGMASGLLAMACSGSCWGLFLTGLAVGFFFLVPLLVVAGVLLTGLFPHSKRQILLLSLVVTGTVGIAMPMAIEALLARLPFPWALHGPFFALAAILALAAALPWRWLSAAEPGARATEPAAARWSWRNLRLPLPLAYLAVLMALHSVADNVAMGWLPRRLDSLEADGIWALLKPGTVLAGMNFVYLATRLAFFALPEHRGERLFMILPGLLGGTALLLGNFGGAYGWLAGGYWLGACCWSWEYPAFLGRMAADDRHFGKAYALSLALSNLLLTAAAAGIAGLIAWRPALLQHIMALPAVLFILIGCAGGAYWLFFAPPAAAQPDAGIPGDGSGRDQ